ncbi:MAG: toxin-antitoxin system HicB family antitoxin [Pseudonocardiales bacterium]|nr:toxin-antitoxin system HicB family antitoxin [Pseudonocardiales bacterium]
MDVTTYVTALREDLAAAAAAGDEQARRTAALLGAAIEPAARLAIMNALSDLAAEVTAALGDRVVEVRLDGRDVKVAVSEPAAEEPHEEPGNSRFGPGFGGRDFGGADLGGDISRMTVRLVEQMKAQAERAAASQGMSLNAWVSQAVQGALGKPGRGGHPRGGDWNPPGDSRRVRGWTEG